MALVRPLAALGPLAVSLALVAGCGGSTAASGTGGASMVPSSAPYFVSVVTDEQSEQWRQAGELVRRLPGGAELLDEALSGAGNGADWKTEIEPALGPELVVTMTDVANDDSGVVLTQPDDVDAFKKLAAQADEPGVAREIDGWWAAAPSEETLDRFEDALGDGRLEDSDAFRQAVDDLPSDRLVTVYASSPGGLSGNAALQENALRCLNGGAESEPSAFAISTREGGFRLDASDTETAFEVDAGAAALASHVPADAVLFADGRNGAGALRQALACAEEELGTQLDQVEMFTGVSLERDLFPLFEGETAVAAVPHGQDVALTLLTEVDDTDDVLASFDRHLEALGPFLGNLTIRHHTVDGREVRTVMSDGSPSFSYAAADGLLAVSNVDAGLALLDEPGASLADDAAYLDARTAAGTPDETAGLLYVDVVGIARLSEPDASADADALAGLVVWGERDGDGLTTQGFLAID